MGGDDYKQFAADYAQLEIESTFYLAYRDLPELIEQHVSGQRALDFGCGAGRSTRFLAQLGLDVTGVDNSEAMIDQARQQDDEGDYQLIEGNELPFADNSFDLILACIVFMELSSRKQMKQVLKEMERVLAREGTIIIVTDAEDMYRVDSASFIYPDRLQQAQHSQQAKQSQQTQQSKSPGLDSGDQVTVKLRGTGVELQDYYWQDKDYRQAFTAANLQVTEMRQPLATGDEPCDWVSETEVPHWTIYVLESEAESAN